jgi:hypothetical protein
VKRSLAVLGILCVPLLVSCSGSREVESPPDERFGHRFEDRGPEGRRTLDVTPVGSEARYFSYPAVVDTVHARPASFQSDLVENGRVPVEILVKGSLPDACSELHEARQERAGHIINMRLEMRRPQGAVCATVVRPFRFYLQLDGTFEPGSYTIRLNHDVYTFSVRGPEPG